jgi:hypothetical protein
MRRPALDMDAEVADILHNPMGISNCRRENGNKEKNQEPEET